MFIINPKWKIRYKNHKFSLVLSYSSLSESSSTIKSDLVQIVGALIRKLALSRNSCLIYVSHISTSKSLNIFSFLNTSLKMKFNFSLHFIKKLSKFNARTSPSSISSLNLASINFDVKNFPISF